MRKELANMQGCVTLAEVQESIELLEKKYQMSSAEFYFRRYEEVPVFDATMWEGLLEAKAVRSRD
jgi:hypothetical protein